MSLRTCTIADEKLRLHLDKDIHNKRDFIWQHFQLGQPAMED